MSQGNNNNTSNDKDHILIGSGHNGFVQGQVESGEIKIGPECSTSTALINSTGLDDMVHRVGGPIHNPLAIEQLEEFLGVKESSSRFNEGKPEWSQVDFQALIPMVRVLEYGAKKYDKHNWKKPPKDGPVEHLDSLCRHLFALMAGEANDPESGLPHIGHIMANAKFYSYHTNANKDLK